MTPEIKDKIKDASFRYPDTQTPRDHSGIKAFSHGATFGYSLQCEEKDRRIKELEDGLRDIANPMIKIQEDAKAEGNIINGGMVIQLCNDANWLKEKAKQLLTDK